MASLGDKRHQLPTERAVLLSMVLAARWDGEGLLAPEQGAVSEGFRRLETSRRSALERKPHRKAKSAILEMITAKGTTQTTQLM